MVKAVADCFWLHIHAPGYNSNVHSLEDVDLLKVCYLVLEALNEEAIETAPIVSLEVSDNSCVARLNLQGRVWWQIEHGCVGNVTTNASCNCGCGLLLSQRERHGLQLLQMARTENYLMTLFLLISCLN
jgi:hypothetical protein